MGNALLHRAKDLVRRWWQPASTTRGGRFAVDTFHAVQAVAHGFRGEQINARAGHLTFISIFSLAPLFTVALALLQLLQGRQLERLLSRFARDLLAPGIQAESAAFLERFITAASARTAGGVGSVFLLFSAGMLLRQLDGSLDAIWNVRRSRPLLLRLLLYAAALTVGPVTIAFSLVGSTRIRSLLVQWGFPFSQQALALGAAAASVGVLTALYKLAPNAPVRTRSAFAGGLVAGIAWEIAKHSYSAFAGFAFQRNPIYGSLGAAPLFLMWLYLSWWLVLFGARLAYAIEQAEFRGEFMDVLVHPRAKELLAARVAQVLTAARQLGLPAPKPRELARQLNAPPQLVAEVVHLLRTAGLVELQQGGLVPARDPSEMTLADLSGAVGGTAKPLRRLASTPKSSEFQHLEQLFGRADDAALQQLRAISWAALAQLWQPPGIIEGPPAEGPNSAPERHAS